MDRQQYASGLQQQILKLTARVQAGDQDARLIPTLRALQQELQRVIQGGRWPTA